MSRDDDAPSGTSVTFPATAEATGSARLTARDTGTEIALEADGLDAGDWYWLWLTGADGDRVGAGTFQGTGGNIDVTLTAALGLEDALAHLGHRRRRQGRPRRPALGIGLAS